MTCYEHLKGKTASVLPFNIRFTEYHWHFLTLLRVRGAETEKVYPTLRKHYLRPIGNRSHIGRWRKSVVTCFGWKVSQWWMKSRNLYENRKDCVTNQAKSDSVIIKRFFGHLDIWGDKLSAQTQGWTFRVIERQQSSARTVLGSNRPQRLICSRRRSYIPATVPQVSSAVWYFHPTVSFYVLCWSHCELY